MSAKQPIIGITERGDAGLDFSWKKEYERYVCDGVILITKHLSPQFIKKYCVCREFYAKCKE